jgi:hypothetical protein
VRAWPAAAAAGPEGVIARRWWPREIRARFLYDGLHADAWLCRRFMLSLPPGARGARLALDGLAGPQPVRVCVDRGPAREVDLDPSHSQIVDVDLSEPGDGDGHVITLEFARWREQATTSQLDLDRRREAARLVWLDLR